MVIGQVLPRGSSVRGLLYYLFTEALAGEKGLQSAHTDARVLAGCEGAERFRGAGEPAHRTASRVELDRAQLKRLKPVCHLSIAAAKEPESGALVDRHLTDEQWADIARVYMDRIGPAKRRDDTGVRWVAVRTPTITCTSWRPWRGKTDRALACPTTATGRGRRAGSWRTSTDS